MLKGECRVGVHYMQLVSLDARQVHVVPRSCQTQE